MYKTDILFCHKFSTDVYLKIFISSEYFNCYKVKNSKWMYDLILSELNKGLYMTHWVVLFFERLKIKNLEKN